MCRTYACLFCYRILINGIDWGEGVKGRGEQRAAGERAGCPGLAAVRDGGGQVWLAGNQLSRARISLQAAAETACWQQGLLLLEVV